LLRTQAGKPVVATRFPYAKELLSQGLRQDVDGAWTDDLPSDDAAGRALLGLGTAVARAPWTDVRDRALVLFGEAAEFRSEHAALASLLVPAPAVLAEACSQRLRNAQRPCDLGERKIR
jgi:hypothetical protein